MKAIDVMIIALLAASLASIAVSAFRASDEGLAAAYVMMGLVMVLAITDHVRRTR